MARKRGRPPKTPSSSAKKTPDKHAVVADDHARIDLSMSDEEALEDIDNLSPKKAMALLRNLDVLRDRVKSKIPTEEKAYEGLKPHEEEGVDMSSQAKKGETKQPSVWDNFDISKLRNAGEKLNYVEPEIKEGVALGKIDLEDVESLA
ncbi:hypothetical protein RIF29_29430 [Crotalaria pallida]|uniref:Uncharacterized protein n=1 Tax=Crotalaria pallida TaxID=3830 RepID=A0AAN9HXH1_CROPI